jgi:hypothetical protein
MGGIIGGLVSGVGGLIGAHQQQQASERAAQTALTGYNYLNSGAGAPASQHIIQQGQTAGDQQGALLGLGGNTAAAQQGFKDYQNSTGYQFQLGQGQRAVSTNAATAGLLNSGGNEKALAQYGQGLAGQSFNNYLGQMNTLRGAGQQQLGMVSGAGSGFGAMAASNAIQGGGAALGSATASMGGAIGNSIAPAYNAFHSGSYGAYQPHSL